MLIRITYLFIYLPRNKNSALPENIVLAGEKPILPEMYAFALQVTYYGSFWVPAAGCIPDALSGLERKWAVPSCLLRLSAADSGVSTAEGNEIA